eukprot:COSAG01_NODE_1812_length_9179_cov_36.648789_4_plen_116_part_00
MTSKGPQVRFRIQRQPAAHHDTSGWRCAAGMLPGAAAARRRAGGEMSADTLTVVKSDKEWRELLSGPSYRVLRKKGTEPAGAGRYNSFFPQSGYFACGACPTAGRQLSEPPESER